VTRLLVANRGEIAVRIARTAHAMGIEVVAVHSDPDAGAPHVRAADVSVRLPGATPRETYLRADLLVAAASVTGADAVHPGYGFLSEDAGFAAAVLEAGLTWVGPPPEAVAAMGSKLNAKRLVRAAGVPTLPWAEVGGGPLAQESADLSAALAEVGLPLLVKASAGGGGRGMRVVRVAEDLAGAVAAAAREAAAAFGDGTVFLERYVERPRHIEVQVLADLHGAVVSLHERECSLQRRHQKVVEEAPSPVVDAALRARLSAAAVATARAVGYVGAGTVEFVLSPDGEPAFLEMNTRLQVEHPVTELVTGLDLVRLQLLVARGEPLPPEAVSPALHGHAVEARLYAEDPARGWLPRTGVLRTFEVPEAPGVRVDAGVESGSEVSHYYDPMLAKVVAHAPTRREALDRLATALAGARLHGVGTNRDALVRLLRSPPVRADDVDTGWLDRVDLAALGAPLATPEAERWHAAAATLALGARQRAAAGELPDVPYGWRNLPSEAERTAWSSPSFPAPLEVARRYDRAALRLEVAGEPLGEYLRLHRADPGEVDLEVDGVRRRASVLLEEDCAGTVTAYVDSPLGASTFGLLPRFPPPDVAGLAGSLRAPMPGTVVRVLAAAGEKVTEGQPLLVLEAMKMEHVVAAASAGTVTSLSATVGGTVAGGDVLVVVEPPPG